MQSSITPLKKIKTTQKFRPRRRIIQNLLNYSQAIEIIRITNTKSVIWINN
jgi:hypothetical protein